MQELDAIIAKSLWVSLTKRSRDFVMGPTLLAQNPGKHMFCASACAWACRSRVLQHPHSGR